MDLVEVSPDAKPPVCHIMDYGKFKFQLSKRNAVARKKQKRIQVRNQLRPATEEADYQVKLRSIISFWKMATRQESSVRFRGREMSHPSWECNYYKEYRLI